jgi:hypothetical protein
MNRYAVLAFKLQWLTQLTQETYLSQEDCSCVTSEYWLSSKVSTTGGVSRQRLDTAAKAEVEKKLGGNGDS